MASGKSEASATGLGPLDHARCEEPCAGRRSVVRSSASCKSFKVVYGPFFHGGNTGSNPVGEASLDNYFQPLARKVVAKKGTGFAAIHIPNFGGGYLSGLRPGKELCDDRGPSRSAPQSVQATHRHNF
jgi:hypothetical protein